MYLEFCQTVPCLTFLSLDSARLQSDNNTRQISTEPKSDGDSRAGSETSTGEDNMTELVQSIVVESQGTKEFLGYEGQPSWKVQDLL